MDKVAISGDLIEDEPKQRKLWHYYKGAEDSALVYVSDDRWEAFQEWSMRHE